MGSAEISIGPEPVLSFLKKLYQYAVFKFTVNPRFFYPDLKQRI